MDAVYFSAQKILLKLMINWQGLDVSEFFCQESLDKTMLKDQVSFFLLWQTGQMSRSAYICEKPYIQTKDPPFDA